MTFQAQGSVLFGVKNLLSQLKGKKTLIRFSSSIRPEVGGGHGSRKGIADLIKLGVKISRHLFFLCYISDEMLLRK